MTYPPPRSGGGRGAARRSQHRLRCVPLNGSGQHRLRCVPLKASERSERARAASVSRVAYRPGLLAPRRAVAAGARAGRPSAATLGGVMG